jgi:hypothetical protein
MSNRRITSISIQMRQRRKGVTSICPEKEPGVPDAHLPVEAVIPEEEVEADVIPEEAVAAVQVMTLIVAGNFIKNLSKT